MKRFKLFFTLLCIVSTFSLFGCSNGAKSVNLTLENFEDYLDVSVTTSNSSSKLNVDIKSRNSDYIFENCEIEILPLLYGDVFIDTYTTNGSSYFHPKSAIKIKIERNGTGHYREDYWEKRINGNDGKQYYSHTVSSYSIKSIKGKVSKNQLS